MTCKNHGWGTILCGVYSRQGGDFEMNMVFFDKNQTAFGSADERMMDFNSL